MATYAKEQDITTDVVDDPQARQTLQEVFQNTARWPAGFKGFSADCTVNLNGKEEQCTVTVKAPRDIQITAGSEEARSFLTENLGSIAMHRGPRSFEESDGKYKLHFMDEGTHPLGRAVAMGGDGMSSFYRLKDGRIQQINRMGQHFAFSINVEESVKNVEGKYLTRRYTVYYFHPENRALKDVESYTDEYARVGQADLPRYRRIINCEEGEVRTHSMTLSNHQLLA